MGYDTCLTLHFHIYDSALYIIITTALDLTNQPYWWFAYDVIKNVVMQIMINLPPNFDMTDKYVSLQNLELFG